MCQQSRFLCGLIKAPFVFFKNTSQSAHVALKVFGKNRVSIGNKMWGIKATCDRMDITKYSHSVKVTRGLRHKQEQKKKNKGKKERL